MEQKISIEGVIKELGMNEVRFSLLLKDAQIRTWKENGKTYTRYYDLMTLLRYRLIKHKVPLAENPNMAREDELLSLAQACDYLGVSRSTLNRLRKEGVVETISVGKGKKISRISLENAFR